MPSRSFRVLIAVVLYFSVSIVNNKDLEIASTFISLSTIVEVKKLGVCTLTPLRKAARVPALFPS